MSKTAERLAHEIAMVQGPPDVMAFQFYCLSGKIWWTADLDLVEKARLQRGIWALMMVPR